MMHLCVIVFVFLHSVFVLCQEPLNTCCYMFNYPQLPSFTLPAGYTEDITLNVGNQIISYDGKPIGPNGCTSTKFEYFNTNTNKWESKVKQGGELLDVPNFNVTNSVFITFKSLQPYQYDLKENLKSSYGRVWLTCEKLIPSCIQFIFSPSKSVEFISPTCETPPPSPAPTTPAPTTPAPPEPIEPPFPRPENTCCFKFKYPQIPTFYLPPAVPYSPGEIIINQDNPIISSLGVNIKQGCSGDQLEYYSETTGWTSTYIDSDGNKKSVIDVLYATENKIKARTIQSWQSNLPNVLNGRLVRLSLTCDNYKSCVQFTINGYEEDVAYPKCNRPVTPAPTPDWQIPENNCCYTFAFPNLPSFKLPDPSSVDNASTPILNPDNRIVSYTAKSKSLQDLKCTGSNFRYFDNSTWTFAYTDADGSIRTDTDLFKIVKNDQIQFIGYRPSQQTFYDKMQNRYGKIDVSCTGSPKSCVMFVINGKQQEKTDQKCSSGIRVTTGYLWILVLVFVVVIL
ncbi:unconventional myosin [Acrasis kona]|uniref:Unconventional myosin n=1 Tax=Acrasis kona TaxID=1008807 RepID=A0AAW2ZJN9_9EUKA